jgi:threonine dehydratase
MSNIENETVLSYENVVRAYERISPILPPTPVLTSTTLDTLCGGKQVFVKCENFQKTGSFKARGALNAVLSALSSCNNTTLKPKGFVSHSSGNHGQAVAWACMQAGSPCTIVLPSDTPQIKVDAVRGYQARVVFCEPNSAARVQTCKQIAADEQLLIIPPYDDYRVMCGQGTVARELLEQVPDLDAVVVAVSGGGLISGVACYAKHVRPGIRVFAVEPQGKELSRCIAEGRRDVRDTTAFLATKAEGIRTSQCGELTFPFVQSLVDDVFTVSDEEMVHATRLVFERMKLVNELSAGAAVAAAMSEKMRLEYPDVRKLGVILCGGNIDVNQLPW